MNDNECTRCGWDYPYHVPLNPVIGSIHSGDVCGICAAEMIAAIHGVKQHIFRQGSHAEYCYESALEARHSGTAKPPKEID